MKTTQENIIHSKELFLQTADEKVYKVPYTVEKLKYEECNCEESHIYTEVDFEIYTQESNGFFKLSINLEKTDIPLDQVIYTGVNLKAFQSLSTFNEPKYLNEVLIKIGIPEITINSFEENQFRMSTTLWIVTTQFIVPKDAAIPNKYLDDTNNPHNFYYTHSRPCRRKIIHWTISECIKRENERKNLVWELNQDY